MKFTQAKERLRSDTSKKFLGLSLEAEKQYLHFFSLEAQPDNPQQIDLFYSGSFLFDMSSDEGNYSLKDVPESLVERLEQTRFKKYDDIADLYYMIPAQILYTLFPELPNPTHEILCKSSKALFSFHAGELIKRYWK